MACIARVLAALTIVSFGTAAASAQTLTNKPVAPTELPPLPADAAPPEFVLITTNYGEVLLELDAARAPISVQNFLAYAKSGFYNDTAFHRVMRNGPTAIVQGGGYSLDGKLKPTQPPIANEWTNGLKNVRGTIAMARQPDPNSATSQFFFNLVDQPLYDIADQRGGGYCVFGKVRAGLPVLDAISIEKTGAHVTPATAATPAQTLPQWPVRACSIVKVEVIPLTDAAIVAERVKNTQVKDPHAQATRGATPVATPVVTPNAPPVSAPAAAPAGATPPKKAAP